MKLQELEKKYIEVINTYEKEHTNYKKYKFWMLFCSIALAFIPIISILILTVIDYIFHTNFLKVSPIPYPLIFAFGPLSALLINDKLRRKLILNEKEIDNIYERYKPVLKEHVNINSIDLIIEMIDGELSKKTKNYFANLVIAGTLSLAIWQTLISKAFEEDLPILHIGIVFLLAALLLTFFIKGAIDLIKTFVFRIVNSRYDSLEWIAYFLREYRLEISQ
ncbi:hypothetical protein [Ornithinibacillus contaminans]|uniref:hypothetical protein n=1 Tax=Ornithinibacillus contaminans TaxID=694055 RepID=UPI00064DAC28|nr:hypothetical protein [Ornithinibacillus contaminans]